MKPLIQEQVAKSYKDLSGCNVSKHKIELTDEAPVFHNPFRMSEYEREELKIEINELLDAGIIRPSKSEWSARAFFVAKKGTKKRRLVIDYRPLNKKMKKRHWPMPK